MDFQVLRVLCDVAITRVLFPPLFERASSPSPPADMAARVGRAPPTRRQQLAPKRLRDAHGDGESYRKEVTREVALSSIIVMVVHVVMEMVIVI